MNLLKKGMIFLFAATLFVACSDDDDPVVVPDDPTVTDPTDPTDPTGSNRSR